MTPLAPHISAWFLERLPKDRCASQHTIDSYAITFRLLFEFAANRLCVAPADLMFEQLDAPLVLAFLEHIQKARKNSGRTRNARLAAVKSFMRFMQYRLPAGLNQIHRVLAIPKQRVDVRAVGHLDDAEVRAVLDVPDPATRTGVRDRAMLLLAVTGGLRVSELVTLRVEQVAFRDRYVDVRIRGKGRRERALTLWKSVADALRAWLAVRGDPSAPEVFVNARGEAMTRSGARYILRKHADAATVSCPSLANKQVSPHVLRHTCAVNTLRATRDIRKVALWLGHASVQTTEVYLQTDPAEKLETLEAVVPPSLKKGRFRPPDKVLELLRTRGYAK
jgi:site-specific recombinase XerD